jgi:hypothetical protein
VGLGWLLNDPSVIQLLLRLIEVVLSEADIVISSEVRDCVVDWVTSLWWLKRSLHFVVKGFLSLYQVLLSSVDVSVSAEVRDIVVDIPVWFLPRGM